jgi:hypothetical protein
MSQVAADVTAPFRPYLRNKAGRFCRDPAKPSRPRHKPVRLLQPLTREVLDKRSNAFKLFNRLAADIEADLGGRDQLSTIELTLIEAYVGAAVTLQHMNTRLALGQEIDLSQHAQAVSAMVRVASRLGLQRRARTVGGPTLGDLLRADQEEQRREDFNEEPNAGA